MQETASLRRLPGPEVVRDLVERLRDAATPPLGDVTLHAVHRPDPGVVLSAWRIGLESAPGEPTDTIVTLHQGPPSRIQRDQRHFEGHAEQNSMSPLSGCVLDGDETMVVSFPSDHRLRDLRGLCRASHILRLVASHAIGATGPGERFSKRRSRCSILRYVPEQRAVLAWDLPIIDDANGEVLRTVSVHVLVDDREPVLDPRIVADSLAAAGVHCPTVVARPHAGVMLETTVPGAAWSGTPADAAVLGEAVARLHGAATPDDATRSGVLDELDRVLRACRILAATDGELGAHAFAVADALAEEPPPPCPRSMLHGSLRPSRFRLHAGRPGLVGLSRATVGSAAMDLASLRSDANWDALDPGWLPSFEQGYASVRPLPAAAALRWYLAAAMVRTACRRGSEATDRKAPDTCRWLDQARTLARSTTR